VELCFAHAHRGLRIGSVTFFDGGLRQCDLGLDNFMSPAGNTIGQLWISKKTGLVLR
jgi:hypothetical protein